MSGQQLYFAFNEAEVTINLDPDIPEPNRSLKRSARERTYALNKRENRKQT